MWVKGKMFLGNILVPGQYLDIALVQGNIVAGQYLDIVLVPGQYLDIGGPGCRAISRYCPSCRAI